MRVIKPFEDMEPTYRELAEAMTELGFLHRTTSDYLVFYNSEIERKILVPQKKLHQRLDAGRFGAVSSQLEHFGIITHMDDLGKMIKRKRLAAQQQAA